MQAAKPWRLKKDLEGARRVISDVQTEAESVFIQPDLPVDDRPAAGGMSAIGKTSSPKMSLSLLFGPAGQWTNATIARIMTLHACQTVWGTASRRNSQVGLGAVLALDNEQALIPPSVRRQPGPPSRAGAPANTIHSSTKNTRERPFPMRRMPSQPVTSRRLCADSRRR